MKFMNMKLHMGKTQLFTVIFLSTLASSSSSHAGRESTSLATRLREFTIDASEQYEGGWLRRRKLDAQVLARKAIACTARKLKKWTLTPVHAVAESLPVVRAAHHFVVAHVRGTDEGLESEGIRRTAGGGLAAIRGVFRGSKAIVKRDPASRGRAFEEASPYYGATRTFLANLKDPEQSKCIEASIEYNILKELRYQVKAKKAQLSDEAPVPGESRAQRNNRHQEQVRQVTRGFGKSETVRQEEILYSGAAPAPASATSAASASESAPPSDLTPAPRRSYKPGEIEAPNYVAPPSLPGQPSSVLPVEG